MRACVRMRVYVFKCVCARMLAACEDRCDKCSPDRACYATGCAKGFGYDVLKSTCAGNAVTVIDII